MILGAISTYATIAVFPVNMIVIAGIFGSLGIASGVTWVGFGTALQPLIKNAKTVRVFNVTMAGLLVASLYPIVAGAWG